MEDLVYNSVFHKPQMLILLLSSHIQYMFVQRELVNIKELQQVHRIFLILYHQLLKHQILKYNKYIHIQQLC